MIGHLACRQCIFLGWRNAARIFAAVKPGLRAISRMIFPRRDTGSIARSNFAIAARTTIAP